MDLLRRGMPRLLWLRRGMSRLLWLRRGMPRLYTGLFFLPLIGYLVHQFFNNIRIPQEIVLLKLHVIIKFKNIGNAGRQVDADNFLVGDVF